MKMSQNTFYKKNSKLHLTHFSKEQQEDIFQFHQSLPDYQVSPLYRLDQLAEFLNVDKIWLKDESTRFGLKAFKGLGVSYALANYFSKELDLDLRSLSFSSLIEEIKKEKPVTLATATDGNHGKSLAWAGQLFQQAVIVYMPKGASEERVQAIRDWGAQVLVTDVNYDATVDLAASEAEKNGWLLVQDTAWSGYESIPLTIMQGYSTIMSEIKEELKEEINSITHLVLQVGVGSFASAMSSSLLALLEKDDLHIILLESDQADPYFRSMQTESKVALQVDGNLDTMMAGLACGKANPLAFELLSDQARHSFSCSDVIATRGMKVLGNPMLGDPAIQAGESGALPMGFLFEIASNPTYHKLKTSLSLDEHARILMINTEGDTDPKNYRKVVWS